MTKTANLGETMNHRLVNLRKTTAGCSCGATYSGSELRAQHAAHKADAKGSPVAATAIAKKTAKAAKSMDYSFTRWNAETKTSEKVTVDLSGFGLPEASARFFADCADDAANWSGSPLIGGNVAAGRSAGGYLARIKAAGLADSYKDEDQAGCYWMTFTEKGRELCVQVLGFDPDPS